MRELSDIGLLGAPKRSTISDAVADKIAEAISTRVIRPGERLVENALVEQLGVSRVPVREALKVLHAQGIIGGGSHRGYRVAEFDADVTQQVMEVRLALETFLLRDAIEAWRHASSGPEGLAAPIAEMKAAAAAGDMRRSLLADLEFHRVMRDAASNPVVGALWDTIARHVLIVFNFERYRDEDLCASAAQHETFRDWIVTETRRSETPFAEIQRALEDHILLFARKKDPRIEAILPG